MLKMWTISRATGVGVSAGLAALILWPAYAAYQEPLRLPYIAALSIAAFCGLSILAMTLIDVALHRRRGRRVRPVRAFDLLIALLLSAPALAALNVLLRDFK